MLNCGWRTWVTWTKGLFKQSRGISQDSSNYSECPSVKDILVTYLLNFPHNIYGPLLTISCRNFEKRKLYINLIVFLTS